MTEEPQQHRIEHQVGLGTGQLKEEVARAAVTCALQNDYTLIDTAARYGNEIFVGQAIKESGVNRKSFEVITKGPHDAGEQGYENTRRLFEQSQENLGLDVIDYYLIHWPTGTREQLKGTWQAMEELKGEGRIGRIGVSNFTDEHLTTLLEFASIKPAVNQIEFHVGLLKPQQALVDFCLSRNIEVQGYATFANGRYDTEKENPVLSVIAKNHSKTIRQIMTRWSYQHGVTPLVRSSDPKRIIANRQIDDFKLIKEEMEAINDLTTGERLFTGPENILSD